MIEPALVALVLADPPTAAILADRFFPLVLPEDGLKPAATYRLISTVDYTTLDGNVYLTKVRIQIDAWGQTYADARSLSNALYLLLVSYTGTVQGVPIALIARDGESSGFDANERAYWVQTDWMIQYSPQ